jgi:ketosteroid isomerase-like protein
VKHTGVIVVCWAALLLSPNVRAQDSMDSGAAGDIRALLDLQSRAWNSGDIDGYMKGYWESDSLLFTSGGNIERGWLAARNKYKRSYGTKALMGTLTFSGIEVHLLSDESAWVFGHWMLEREGDRPHGVFTLVLRKFPEGWKIVHDHTSAEIPKPASGGKKKK